MPAGPFRLGIFMRPVAVVALIWVRCPPTCHTCMRPVHAFALCVLQICTVSVVFLLPMCVATRGQPEHCVLISHKLWVNCRESADPGAVHAVAKRPLRARPQALHQ